MPDFSKDELEAIISKAVRKELAAVGLRIDSADGQEAVRDDLRFARRMRQSVESAASRIGMTILAALIGGALLALWEGLKLIGRGAPERAFTQQSKNSSMREYAVYFVSATFEALTREKTMVEKIDALADRSWLVNRTSDRLSASYRAPSSAAALRSLPASSDGFEPPPSTLRTSACGPWRALVCPAGHAM
jgi:hypothetical protein